MEVSEQKRCRTFRAISTSNSETGSRGRDIYPVYAQERTERCHRCAPFRTDQQWNGWCAEVSPTPWFKAGLSIICH